MSIFERILIGRSLGFLLGRGLGIGETCPRVEEVRLKRPLSALIQHAGESTQSQTSTTRAHGKRLHCRLGFAEYKHGVNDNKTISTQSFFNMIELYFQIFPKVALVASDDFNLN